MTRATHSNHCAGRRSQRNPKKRLFPFGFQNRTQQEGAGAAIDTPPAALIPPALQYKTAQRLEARSADGSRLTSGPAPSAATRTVFEKLRSRGYAVALVLAAVPAMASPISSVPPGSSFSMLTETTPYASLNEAAKAAEKVAIGLSVKDGNEWGGLLLLRNGSFYFTDPITDGSRQGVGVRAKIPGDAKVVGGYHTHPGLGNCASRFSSADVDISRHMGVPEYIGVVHDGSIRRFIPGLDTVDVGVCERGSSAGKVIA